MGEFTILERRGPLALAQDPEGRPLWIAFGERTLLEAEARALRLMAVVDDDVLEVAEVEAVGEDAEHGTYLALRRREMSDAVGEMDLGSLLATLEAILDIDERLEDNGLQWVPRAEDLELEGDGPSLRGRLSRLRVVPSPSGQGDARKLIQTLGTELLRHAPLTIPTRLLHLLYASPGLKHPGTLRDQIREEVTAAWSDWQALENAPNLGSAAETDVGLLRERNEDAVALQTGADWTIAVVCDGISSSKSADETATLAAEITRARLVDYVDQSPSIALERSIEAAHLAICQQEVRARVRPHSMVPEATYGTTVVAAICRGRHLALGWVGDSRAYLVGPTTAVQLTRDHSWINETVESGTMSFEEASLSPYAHALTRCLGPLEGSPSSTHARADIIEIEAKEPGWLLLVSDGFWNYYAHPEWVAALVKQAGPDVSASVLVRLLVNAALLRGGHDNVSVAAIAIA